MTDDDILWRLEQEEAARERGFRAWLLAEAGPEALAKHDARMKAVRLGTDRACMTWHSISPTQRRALLAMHASDGRVVRGAIRLATMRNLASRDLIAWDGGAFDPEASAVLTERGRFVIAHGSSHSCPTCRK